MATENGTGEVETKFSNRINRPKRIQPLLNEREKPPLDVVSKAKMIFEKRPETRTKKPPQTGDVAAKVEGFNNIIVKTKVANCTSKNKPPIKHSKPVLSDKQKNTHPHHRPVAKPIILSPDDVKAVTKPRTLELNANNRDKKHHNKWNNKWDVNLPSPIPDVSRVDQKNSENNHTNSNNLCETPDLILTSSPVQMLHSPTFKKNTTEKFLRTERSTGVEATNGLLSPVPSPTRSPNYHKSPQLNVTYTKEKLSPMDTPKSTKFGGRISPSRGTRSPTLVSPRETFGSIKESSASPKSFEDNANLEELSLSPGFKVISPVSQKNISKNAVGSSVFDFTSNGNHLPKTVNKNVSEKMVPTSEPLQIEVNGHNGQSSQSVNGKQVIDPEKSDKNLVDIEKSDAKFAGVKISDTENNQKHRKSYPTLNLDHNNSETKSVSEVTNTKISENNGSAIENNSSDSDNNKLVLPRKLKPRVEESSQVFNFTKERRDVPDYISNDTSRTPQKPTLPQPGEGGIILIAGATMTSSFIDEDEEILRSLEGPPSPCDVTFVNDNILIGGRSSLIKESRRSKMKISFIETTDIFEYPSEDSLLVDTSNASLHSPSQAVGHSVPMLSGSTLANYMPKTMEEFQLGVTKTYPSSHNRPDVTDVTDDDMLHEEVSHPSIFSNTTNADMLF